jgi:hypothetical protein
MPLNPGNVTLTFENPGVVVDRLHKAPAVAESSFDQPGSTIQCKSVKDDVNDTAYSEATHIAITLFNNNTSSVEAEWFVHFGGDRYRVIGSEQIRDAWARIFYIKFILKKEFG